MKHYNRALDRMTLAMAYAVKGESTKAAKMFASAIKEPDVKRAIATLEASNSSAFAVVQAAAKKKVAASKKVTAGDDLDMGDEEDLDALIGDDAPAEEVEEEEVEEAAFDEDEDEEDEGFDDAEFAKVLASMTKPAAKPKRK